jgi:hypothetical protein
MRFIQLFPMKKTLRLIALGFFLTHQLQTVVAQQRLVTAKSPVSDIGGNRIDWEDPVTEIKYDGTTRSYLLFEGAVYLDESSLPYVVHNIKVSPDNTVKANLKDERYVPLTASELVAVEGLSVPNAIKMGIDRYVERKQPYERV